MNRPYSTPTYMPLDPQAQAFLDERARLGSKSVAELTVEQAREQSNRFARMNPIHPVAATRDLEIPGPGGSIPIRLYYPTAGTLPILVFFHGGGFVLGNLANADAVCRDWANGSQCLVVSVNYRHAPEHKYPAAANDAYAATRWVSEHAAELGGDATRLAVAGMSAGGNLAAVVAQMARDRGAPPLALQVLWVPVIDRLCNSPSYAENAEGYGLTRSDMLWFWEQYLDDTSKAREAYVSPIYAASLENLPPAIVLTAQYDPLRDEGIAYANALATADGRVTHNHYPGMIHGFLGAQAAADTFAAIRTHFNS